MPKCAAAAFVLLVSTGCGYVSTAPDGTPRPLKDARCDGIYGVLRGTDLKKDGKVFVVFDVVNASGWPIWIHRLGPVHVQFENAGHGMDFALPQHTPELYPQIFMELPNGKSARLRYGSPSEWRDRALRSAKIDILVRERPRGRSIPDPPKWPKKWRTLRIFNPAFLDAVAEESEVVVDASWRMPEVECSDFEEFIRERVLTPVRRNSSRLRGTHTDSAPAEAEAGAER